MNKKAHFTCFNSVNMIRWYLKKIEVVNMNKTELLAAMVEKSELTKKDAEQALSAFMEAVTESLEKEEKVSLIGFGTFEVRHRSARDGRNLQTGEAIKIPASKNPAFKPSKALKEKVN